MSFRPLHSDPFVPTIGNLPSRSPSARTKTVSDESHRRLVWTLALFVTAGLLAILTTKVSAQGFDSFPMPKALENEDTVKRVEAVVKNYATTGQGNINWVNGYYAFYVPAKMTAPDGTKYISELVKEMTSLLGRAQRSNRPDVALQMMRYIFDGMKKVAEGNCHPAARINALLVLSRIDSRPADNSTRTPPTPLSNVTPILIAQYQNEANPDGVRAAALQGLHRHVMYGFTRMSPADRTTVMTAMADLLQAEPPEGRSPKAHAYLQRFAVDMLDVLRPKDDKSLGTKLISISTEPKRPDLIALYSAARVGSMGAELKGQVAAPDDVLKNWSMRALAAFESEIQRFEAFERPKPARSQPQKPETLLGKKTEATQRKATAGGYDEMMDMDDMMGGMEDMEEMMDMGGEGYDMEDMMDMGGMGMGMGMMGRTPEYKTQPVEVLASRRKLNHVLQQLHLGVTGAATKGLPTRNPGGLLASVADEKKPVVEGWITAMELVVTAINDPSREDEQKYLETLKEQTLALRDFLGLEAKPDLPSGVPAAMVAAAVAAAADPVDDLLGAAAADAAGAPVDELAAPADELAAPADELAAPTVDELAP